MPNFDIIRSGSNAQFKALKQLINDARARKKTQQLVLEGSHLCRAWLEKYGIPQAIYVGEEALNHPEVAVLWQATCQKSTRAQILSMNLMQSLSSLEHINAAAGIVFVASLPISSTLNQLTENAVLLDGVQDAGNLGSILRSAAAAGIRHIFASANTVDCWSPKVLRAGQGAHFSLQIAEHCDLPTLLKSKPAAALQSIVTSSHASQSLYQTNLQGAVAWVFGNEGAGVSSVLIDLADVRINIPQAGQESLNVAAAAAVCFFEQVRQHHSKHSQLS